MITDPIEDSLKVVPLGVLARELGVSGQAIRKWQRARRMPRTEWTGETKYGEAIERLTEGAVTRDRLLAPWPRQESLASVGPEVGHAPLIA